MALQRCSAMMSRIVRHTHRAAEVEPCGERDADGVSMVGDDEPTDEPTLAEILVEESSEALIALSAGGVLPSRPRAAERIFGYPLARAIGTRFVDLVVPPDHIAEARAAIEDMAHTG